MMRRALLLAAAWITASAAAAHDTRVGSIAIEHPRVIASTGQTAAGYLTIVNEGTTADALVAVWSAAPQTEVHASAVSADGVATMAPAPVVEIPAGGSVALAPGGLHVMFMGLTRPLTAGETWPATLVFRDAGEVAVDFAVEPRSGGGAMPGMGH